MIKDLVTLVNADGQQVKVHKVEVAAYMANGWSKPKETKQTKPTKTQLTKRIQTNQPPQNVQQTTEPFQ